MKQTLYYLFMVVAGIGIGTYLTCSILYSSPSPFDVMKKQNVLKLNSIKSLFWLCVIGTVVLVFLSNLAK